MKILHILGLASLLWLTGCASTRLVDSDVQSFSQLAGAPARATYAFERLPSQQAQPSGAKLPANMRISPR